MYFTDFVCFTLVILIVYLLYSFKKEKKKELIEHAKVKGLKTIVFSFITTLIFNLLSIFSLFALLNEPLTSVVDLYRYGKAHNYALVLLAASFVTFFTFLLVRAAIFISVLKSHKN